MLDFFQGQSVHSLLICVFSPFSFFTSEVSPQVVAYFTVAMATALGKKTQVCDREEEEEEREEEEEQEEK